MKLTTILMVFITVLFVVAMYYIITFSQAEPTRNANYDEYIKIRDTSDCTKTNDTFCKKAGPLFSSYRDCQAQQCPDVVKKLLLGSQGVLHYV